MEGLLIPGDKLFDLPEKVLQFGTGVLLRGLPDYFIDKANRQGIFNGRVVVVKSTSGGGTDEFGKQDGLFTHCIRGIEDGKAVEETIINSSISRVLSAREEWKEILALAYKPSMEIIISNTTEVGITLLKESISQNPPQSFPAKLLAFLYERYKAFAGAADKGMVIVPTELIIDNGKKLKAIVLELAAFNQLEPAFVEWIEKANHFCDSLVDRIVPGKLQPRDLEITENKLGYKDELMILSESFSLWAIESSNEKVKNTLSFRQADKGMVIATDIEKFRELKLRLLNGTHTFSCGLALLSGFATVKEAMAHAGMFSYVHNLVMGELARAVESESISYKEAADFAGKVLDRFRNPSLEHQWTSISVQYSSKMKMRNIPLLLNYYKKFEETPEHMALGMAAYLLVMRGNNPAFKVQDDHAAVLADAWEANSEETIAKSVLSNQNLWGTDLSELNGFEEAVRRYLHLLVKQGAIETIGILQGSKTMVS